MAEASRLQSFIVNDFSPGWVLKRSSAVAPNAPVIMSNAIVNEDGSIISRSALQRINTQQLNDGLGRVNSKVVHSHTLSKSVRYLGVGGVIKRNFDPGTTIVTGLTGARITMVQASPSEATSELFTYFANGEANCRKKDNGISTYNWGIDGPDKPLTVALRSARPPATLIDSFASGYSAISGGSTGGASEPYETSAQAFTVANAATGIFRRTVTLDLSANGEDAFIRFMARVNRHEALDHFEIAFDVGDGSFTKDYYSVSIPGSVFEADGTWQEVTVRKRDFRRETASTSTTSTWANVAAIQVTVAGTDTQTSGSIVFSLDDMRMEGDTHIDGVVDYQMTWWSDTLKIRSNPYSLDDLYAARSNISDSVQAQRQGTTVARVATTTDTQVTHWEIWRRNRNTDGQFHFIARVPIGQTTYKDSVSDNLVGEILIEDNPIPPVSRFCFTFDDRMFWIGMTPNLIMGPTQFTGDGVDDLKTSGKFTGGATDKRKWVVEITGADPSPSTPDVFRWSNNGGSTFTSGVSITGLAQSLGFGISIAFKKTKGHVVGDKWEFGMDDTGEEQSEYAVRYSPRFRPESAPVTNYLIVGDPEDVIRGYATWQGQIWIFTRRHVYRIVSTGNGYRAELTEAPVGTESPYSISPSPYGIFYYAAKDGPYLFNGSTSTPISGNIEPFFEGEIVTVDGVNIPAAVPVFISQYINVIGQYHELKYYLVIDDHSGNCRTLIYWPEKKRWTRLGGKDLTLQRLASERAGNDFVSNNNLEGGNADGWLMLLSPVVNNPVDPENEEIEFYVQNTFDTIAKPQDVQIDVKDIAIDIDSGGQGVMVEASFDDSPLEIIGAKIPQGREKIIFPVNGQSGEENEGRICYKFSIRITVFQRTERVKLYGIGANYWIEPRASTVLSSMWFAPKECAFVRRGRLVVRSTSLLKMRIVVDEKWIYETTFSSTQGKRLPWSPSVIAGLHGRVSQVTLSSDSPFVIYPGSFIEMRNLGGPSALIPWQLVA